MKKLTKFEKWCQANGFEADAELKYEYHEYVKAHQPTKYSLFERIGGTWKRISDSEFDKQTAIRVYQNRLLDGVFTGRVREIRRTR